MGDERDEPAVVIERRSGGGMGIFLLGAAIGAGLALLFAPQTGDETRAAVRRTARRVRRQARDVADRARDVAERGLDKVDDLARSGKSAAKEAREAIEQRLARRRAGRDESFDGEDDGV